MMKVETALRKIDEINEELDSLKGRCDRTLRKDRVRWNRRSTLYRRRKNMVRIVLAAAAVKQCLSRLGCTV